MADALRYFVLALDCFALGSLLALYERVGRFIFPKAAIRMFLAASIMFLVSVAVEIWERLGDPLRYRTTLAFVALVFYLVGLIRLYRWFGTDEGRRRRHAFVNEFAAHELHQLARLARAMEDDPEHLGRYVQPGVVGRVWRFIKRGGCGDS